MHRPPFLGIDKQRLEINLDGIEIQLVQRNCRKEEEKGNVILRRPTIEERELFLVRSSAQSVCNLVINGAGVASLNVQLAPYHTRAVRKKRKKRKKKKGSHTTRFQGGTARQQAMVAVYACFNS